MSFIPDMTIDYKQHSLLYEELFIRVNIGNKGQININITSTNGWAASQPIPSLPVSDIAITMHLVSQSVMAWIVEQLLLTCAGCEMPASI